MKFVRNFVSIIILIIFLISIVSLVVYNSLNEHLTNPKYLANAAEKTEYAENVARYVEGQMRTVAESFGLQSDIFDDSIKLKDNVYSEILANITAAYNGEDPVVDTTNVKEGIKSRIDLPFGITDALVKSATMSYTMNMGFDFLRSGLFISLKDIQSLLKNMFSMNYLTAVVLIICLIVLIIINRKHKLALWAYILIPILVAGIILSVFALIYFSAGDTLPDVLKLFGVSIPMDTFDALKSIDFAMNLIKAFLDGIIGAISTWGLIMLGVGGVGCIILLFARTNNKSKGKEPPRKYRRQAAGRVDYT